MRTSARAARTQYYNQVPAMNLDHAVSWGRGVWVSVGDSVRVGLGVWVSVGDSVRVGLANRKSHTKGQNHTCTKGRNQNPHPEPPKDPFARSVIQARQ